MFNDDIKNWKVREQNTKNPLERHVAKAVLQVLYVAEMVEFVEVVKEDDSVLPPFNSDPQPLEVKEHAEFMGNRLFPANNEHEVKLLKQMGFTVKDCAEIPNERKKVYITTDNIVIAFAKGTHGEYGIFGPAITRTDKQIELFNEADYWVHARYLKGESGFVDGAAFDIRNYKIENRDGMLVLVGGTARIDHKNSTWFKIEGLEKIEVSL